MTSEGVPEGYPTVSPYLLVTDLEPAVAFLTEVFGARERRRMQGEGGGMHCELELGDSVVMVGAGGGMSSRAMLHVYVADAEAVYRRALAAGASSVSEPHDTSFGDHRVAFDDPSGTQWWVSTRMET
ncbi:MAG: VOC family protein [Actinomycetota bacterium]|nr:VOC family protein [Actinomycetota bacterium]